MPIAVTHDAKSRVTYASDGVNEVRTGAWCGIARHDQGLRANTSAWAKPGGPAAGGQER
jgi:hypothetical protein